MLMPVAFPLVPPPARSELDLSGNALRDVSALGTLPYLLRLNLSGNQRLNAPASFKVCCARWGRTPAVLLG